MGTVCSIGQKTSIGNSNNRLGPKNDNISTQYSISASIVCSAIWNPFRVTRDEAEDVLQKAYPGAFMFSHNVTSEIFLSVSTGKYVCHHPVLQLGQHYEIGGRNFNNVEAAVKFYRINPLGDAVLTEQFNSARGENHSTMGDTRKTSPESLNSPTTAQKSNTKRVTFETSTKNELLSSNTNCGDTSEMVAAPITTQTDFPNEDHDIEEEETRAMFQRLQNKPRKSICRVQPQDSLSTSSGNMFKEEEF